MRKLIFGLCLFTSVATFGQELRTIEGYMNGVHLMAFSPDGKTLLTGSGVSTNQAHLVDVATGERIKELEGFTDAVTEGLWAPSGDWFYTSSGVGPSIKIWSKAGELQRTLEYKGCEFGSHMAIRTDEKQFAVSCDDDVILFNEKWEQTQEFEAPDLYVASTYWPDESHIIIASAGTWLEIVDLKTEEWVRAELDLGGKMLEILPSGELMATEFYFFKSDEPYVRFFKDGEEKSNFTNEGKILFAKWVAGKEKVLLALSGGQVKLVNKDGSEAHDFGRLGTVALSADVTKDGKTAAIGFLDRIVVIDLSSF